MRYTEIILPFKIKSGILALGAQSKASFCFARGGIAYLSDSAGELSDFGNFKKFEKQIKLLQKKFKIRPDVIACDLHPEYVSTKYALRMTDDDRKESRAKPRGGRRPKGVPSPSASLGINSAEGRTTKLVLKKIQHHEAHVASCITDNNIKSEVIGVAFDGTGFGLDGSIWGGEFFVGGIKGLKRAAYLKYIPMPGGEACVKEPWRMAFSYIYAVYGKKGLASLGELGTSLDIMSSAASSRPFFGKGGASPAMTDNKDILFQMIDRKINSPLTSSMGRLFDGVSALIGICRFAGYEGEAAIGLEKIIAGTEYIAKRKYSFKYKNENEIIIIDWEPVIKGIVEDFKKGVDKPEISIKFHNAICDMIKETCNLLKKKYKIEQVCMSGGVFQNKYLSSRIKPMLEEEGFGVYLHRNVPTHDGGIALGQVVLAGV